MMGHTQRTEISGRRTIIPATLSTQHPISRCVYRIRPFKMYGHPIFATKDGAILQNAMMPFGVDGGTKSRAADRMMTYSTGCSYSICGPHNGLVPGLTVVDEAKEEERQGELPHQSLLLHWCQTSQ